MLNFDSINIDHFYKLENKDLTEVLNVESDTPEFLNKCGVVDLLNFDDINDSQYNDELYQKYLKLFVKNIVIQRIAENNRNKLLKKLSDLKKLQN